jgi:hypothetical protein
MTAPKQSPSVCGADSFNFDVSRYRDSPGTVGRTREDVSLNGNPNILELCLGNSLASGNCDLLLESVGDILQLTA